MVMGRKEVAVDFITRLKDKGFKDLDKNTKKSIKSLQKFGKTLGVALSATALVAFVKKSTQQFSELEKSTKRLESELGNLGLAFATSLATDFTRSLALATGTSQDKLVPALQKLVQTTGELTNAQKLLSLATEISNRKGLELEQVTNALSRAFVGDFNALVKLRIGFEKSALEGKNFQDILKELNTQFGTRQADTFGTKIDKLKVGFEEAQIALGKGFVEGLEKSGMSVEELQEKMIELGEKLGQALGKAVTAIDKLQRNLENLSKNRAVIFTLDLLDRLLGIEYGDAGRAADRETAARIKQLQAYVKQLEIAGKTQKLKEAEAALAKEIAAQNKKAADAEARRKKREELENKTRFRFDQDLINLTAALRRDISAKDKSRAIELFNLKKSEYETEVNAIKTLENTQKGYYDLLLNNEKVISETRTIAKTKVIKEIEEIATAATNLTKKEYMLKIDTNTSQITADLAKIQAAMDRYQAQVTSALAPIYSDPIFTKNIVEGLSISEKQLIDSYMRSGGQGVLVNPFRPDVDLNPIIAQIQERERIYNAARGAYKAITPPEELGLTANTSFMGTGDTGGTVVNVNINGSLISQNDLVAAVTDAVYATQRTGNSLIIEQ